jgi:hypothetical protein
MMRAEGRARQADSTWTLRPGREIRREIRLLPQSAGVRWRAANTQDTTAAKTQAAYTANTGTRRLPPSRPPSLAASTPFFPSLASHTSFARKKIDNCALFAKEFARFEPDEGSGLFLTRGTVCSQTGERFVPNEWPGSGLFPMTGALCSQ